MWIEKHIESLHLAIITMEHGLAGLNEIDENLAREHQQAVNHLNNAYQILVRSYANVVANNEQDKMTSAAKDMRAAK